MKLAEHRWVQVIWCDDVRHEMGNKPSFMGVYVGDLIVQSLPITLPRLAANIELCTPRDRPFKSIKVRLTRNDSVESIASIEVPSDDLAKMNADLAHKSEQEANFDSEEPTALKIAFLVMLGPLVLNETTKWLKVFVDTEDESLESFRLKVGVLPSVQPILH